MAADGDQFARMDDGREVAYRVMSDRPGPLILHTPSATWPSDLLDEDPMYDRFLTALGLAGRLVVYDRPGYGSSDPIDPDRDYFEQMTEACIAVIDAERVESAWLVGSTLAAMTEIIRAERARISGAVFLNPIPIRRWKQAIEFGVERRRRDPDEMARSFAPSRADDAAFAEWLRRARRLGASTSDMAALAEMNRAAVRRFSRDAEPIEDPPEVLMIWRRGTLAEDEAATESASAWWQGIFPAAERIVIEGDDWSMPTASDAGYVAELAAGFITGTTVASSEQRRLRAVLFCDLVGSTPTAASSGDAVWRTLLDRYESVVQRTVDVRRGTVVKHTGDGALVTFDSGSQALAAAVELRNRTRDLGLEGRIGLHLGEVEQRGDDIGGIAVNLAARVMGEAGGGQIVVTSAVEETTMGGRFRFEDLGDRRLKGIDRPWRLFAVVL